MVTDAPQPEVDGSDVFEPVAVNPGGELDSVRRIVRTPRQPDVYAEAELLRRHERTESIIRKAREQFS